MNGPGKRGAPELHHRRPDKATLRVPQRQPGVATQHKLGAATERKVTREDNWAFGYVRVSIFSPHLISFSKATTNSEGGC